MRQSTYSSVTPNAMPTQNLKTNTRATRVVLARRPRPNNVRRGRVLPASGWVRPKKLAQLLCLSALNIGTLTGGSRELADTLNNRRIDIACIQETKWGEGKGHWRRIQALLQRQSGSERSGHSSEPEAPGQCG